MPPRRPVPLKYSGKQLLTAQQRRDLIATSVPKAQEIVDEVYTLSPEERVPAFAEAVDLRNPGDAKLIEKWGRDLRAANPALSAKAALVKALARYLAASVLRVGVTLAVDPQGRLRRDPEGIVDLTAIGGLGWGWLGDAYDTTVDWVSDRIDDVVDGADWVYTKSGLRVLVESVVSVASWIIDGIKKILCHPATEIIVGVAVAAYAGFVATVGTAGTGTYAAAAAGFVLGKESTRAGCALAREGADFMKEARAFLSATQRRRVDEQVSDEFAPGEVRQLGQRRGRIALQPGAALDPLLMVRGQRRIYEATAARRAAARRVEIAQLAALKAKARRNARSVRQAQQAAAARLAASRIETAQSSDKKTWLAAAAAVGLVLMTQAA